MVLGPLLMVKPVVLMVIKAHIHCCTCNIEMINFTQAQMPLNQTSEELNANYLDVFHVYAFSMHLKRLLKCRLILAPGWVFEHSLGFFQSHQKTAVRSATVLCTLNS